MHYAFGRTSRETEQRCPRCLRKLWIRDGFGRAIRLTNNFDRDHCASSRDVCNNIVYSGKENCIHQAFCLMSNWQNSSIDGFHKLLFKAAVSQLSHRFQQANGLGCHAGARLVFGRLATSSACRHTCMCSYTHVSANMHAHTYTYAHTGVHVCRYREAARGCEDVRIRIHLCVCTQTIEFAQTHVFAHACARIQMCVCIHMHPQGRTEFRAPTHAGVLAARPDVQVLYRRPHTCVHAQTHMCSRGTVAPQCPGTHTHTHVCAHANIRSDANAYARLLFQKLGRENAVCSHAHTCVWTLMILCTRTCATHLIVRIHTLLVCLHMFVGTLQAQMSTCTGAGARVHAQTHVCLRGVILRRSVCACAQTCAP